MHISVMQNSGPMMRSVSEDIYSQLQSRRNGTPDRVADLVKTSAPNSSISPDFYGEWMHIYPNCITPTNRSGHFSVYSETQHKLWVGYGATCTGELLGDVWCFDTINKIWKQLRLSGDRLPPRTGARGSMFNEIIVLFGGYDGGKYLTDLHTIDTRTGKVTLVGSLPGEPSARSTPITGVYGEEFFVWGGFNGKYPPELNVLDLRSRTWSSIEQNQVQGRTSVDSAAIGDKLYVYGGSKRGGLIVIDLKNKTVIKKMTIGSEPPSAVLGGGMASFDHYIFFFGGKSATSKWTLLYCCDIENFWWFVFHVLPDGETTTFDDGSISDLGLFRLPRMHGFSFLYEPKTRELQFCLGRPDQDPFPVQIIRLADAIPIVNMRDDMLAMTRKHSQ